MNILTIEAASLGEIFAVSTALIWSVAVILYRKMSLRAASWSLNLFKTAFATLCFLLTLPFLGGFSPPDLSPYQWCTLVLSAILGITLGDLFFLMGIKRIGAQMEAIVSCAYTPLVMLLSFLMFGDSIPAIVLTGGGLVVLAVFLGTAKGGLPGLDRRNLAWGIGLSILAQVFMVLGVLIIRDIYQKHDLVWVMAFRFSVATILMLPWFLQKKHQQAISSIIRSKKNLLTVGGGSFLGAYLASILWIAGFKYAPAANVAVYNQLSTVFIFILAAVFLKEPLTRPKILAVCLAFAGAALIALH